MAAGTSTAEPAETAAIDATPTDAASTDADAGRDIIVAVDDAPDVLPNAGSTPRLSYSRSAGYAGSTHALSDASSLAAAFGLKEEGAWTIAPLRLRCMRYRLAPGADRASVLARLSADPQVRLAQPVNEFETLATVPMAASATPEAATSAGSPALPASGRVAGARWASSTAPMGAAAAASPAYNDPYFGLQRGFAAMDTASAQRWARGGGVRVALIDTGVDATHPDLAGQVELQRDFAGAAHPATAGGEAHGTAMAGVIAAGANNGVGIVGMAPQARLDVYRACWPVAGGGSRCDSFTLAEALGAAITDGADIINMSLGGPSDPLLQRLVEHAMRQGAIVVGAVLPGGREGGFPAGVAGVLAVAPAEDFAIAPAAALLAPGRDVLTLTPGGHYDFASGSSLAAAHATGAIALLRSLAPSLTSAMLAQRLGRHAGMSDTGPFNLCAAVRIERPQADCKPL